MKPLRVLSLGHSYVVGANRRLPEALQIAAGDRYHVTIASPSYFHGQNDLRPARLEVAADEPCPVVPLSARLTSRVHFFQYGKPLRELLQQPWDLVHAWEEPYILAGGQIARHLPAHVPFVFRTAQSLPKRYPIPFNFIERAVVRRATGWTCSGQTVEENLLQRSGYPAKPHALIPLGVNTHEFRPDRSLGESVLAELGWNREGPPIIVYMGRFVPEKGLKLLMDALDGVSAQWRIMFLGTGSLEGALRKWASRYGDRVRICTKVSHSQVYRYLNASDILCAPSQTTRRWREQFGRMLIEGMATGLSVVGSDSGEIPYVIGDVGMVVGEKDVRGWTEAIGTLLESPLRRQELAIAGRAKALEQYAWPIIGRKLHCFLDSILAGRA